jgi:hypothetical protein
MAARRSRTFVGKWASARRRSTSGRRTYANLGTSEIRELRELRDENAKLKRLVADLTLDKHILGEIIRKKV